MIYEHQHVESDPSLDAFGLQLVPDSPQVVRIRVPKPGNMEEGKKVTMLHRGRADRLTPELPYSVGPPRAEVLW